MIEQTFRQMVKTIEQLSHRHATFTVFSDFIEMSAIAVANTVQISKYQEREKRYMRIIERYSKDELVKFADLLGMLTVLLEQKPDDYLGKLFMELELYNSWKGQFFTPLAVAEAMAEMATHNIDSIIKDKGYITVNEPTVGGGVTIIALAKVLQKRGYNYQSAMRVTAQDIDSRSVHMTYVQLSLLGINAIVIQGNTLLVEIVDHWKTPNHILNFSLLSKVEELENIKPIESEQLVLF
ncbi:hypothetical protein KP77_25260 [Jeotgalibacillus alimentarius]|uniref:DNA methylase adenine-specific domain-containing protein n=1 Tax=Jeotgalibacillus alimentarius TaxID=135826 RepID=A0A0C2VDD9_9BACL|nr:N-6 DNA methylase [Jeotgalibacillus alimentarius]KIL46957.1 hypothetical protein KP77_25260 [Jeotgalibacillus alimentarius]